jgi:hypothetical protein
MKTQIKSALLLLLASTYINLALAGGEKIR